MCASATFDLILSQQKKWAGDKTYDNNPDSKTFGYFPTLIDNLLMKYLSIQTVDEYSAGRGKELEGHMRAFFSSSAMLVNVFEYWRHNGRISDIAIACGADAGMSNMAFEQKHKIANLGTPHLDIEFTGTNPKPFAIESKFTEPYRRVTQRNRTNLDKYLAQPGLWNGLDKTKQLASEVFDEEGKLTSWKHLDVPQLIKHILGLSYKYGVDGFILTYLWYDFDSLEAREHEGEVAKLQQAICPEVEFQTLKYQELFTRVQAVQNVEPEYVEYLRNRYFLSGCSYVRNCDF